MSGFTSLQYFWTTPRFGHVLNELSPLALCRLCSNACFSPCVRHYPESYKHAILLLASKSVSFDACPPTRRTNSCLPRSSTRPGSLINQKSTAFRRRFTQLPPPTSRFMAELTLNARIMICHHAALAPNNPEGSFPPARSSFMMECASSDLPQRPLYHQISSSPGISRLVTIPVILYFTLPQFMVWKGRLICSSMFGRACCSMTSRIAR